MSNIVQVDSPLNNFCGLDLNVALQFYQFASGRSNILDKSNPPPKELIGISVAQFIPTRSVEELEFLADEEFDAQAMLELGDIYMFGLKGVVRDSYLACEYYWESARIGLPEGLVAAASIVRKEIHRVLYPDDPMGRVPVTSRDLRRSDVLGLYERMWMLLGEAADEGWVSPLTILEFNLARKNNLNVEIRDSVHEAFRQREIEFAKEEEEKKKMFVAKCSNPQCGSQVTNSIKTVPCKGCNIKYCCQGCQTDHWLEGGHGKVCSISAERLMNYQRDDQQQKLDESSDSDNNGDIKSGGLTSVNLFGTNITSRTMTPKFLRSMKRVGINAGQIVESRARLASLHPGITLEQLKEFASHALETNRFQACVRYTTFAIDKIYFENTRKSLHRAERKEILDFLMLRIQSRLAQMKNYFTAEYESKTLEDLKFALGSGVFAKELINDPTIEKKLIKFLKKLSTEFSASDSGSFEDDARALVEQYRPRNSRAKKTKSKAKKSQKKHSPKWTVSRCNELKSLGFAVNALSEEDGCPICMTQWNEFIDPSNAFGIVLVCSHAICLRCLNIFHNECKQEAEILTNFSCPLCRKELDSAILDMAGGYVANSGFERFREKLPNCEDLIVELLKNNNFEVIRVEEILLNMISYMSREEPFDSKEKEEIYQHSRAPVKKLEEDYRSLKEELDSVWDLKIRYSKEYQLKVEHLNEIWLKLAKARNDAAKDIFESMNRFGMGLRPDGFAYVDLHCLHVFEVRSLLLEFVLPVLPVYKKIVLITGRGLHSADGVSKIQAFLKEFLPERGIAYSKTKNNPGAISSFSSHKLKEIITILDSINLDEHIGFSSIICITPIVPF